MNRIVLIFSVGAVSLALSVGGVEAVAHPSAETNSVQVVKKKISPEKLRETIRKVQMKKTGGIVRNAESMKGVFVVLNAQKKVPQNLLSPVTATIEMGMHVQAKFVQMNQEPSFKELKPAVVNAGGVLGVLIVEGDWPSITIAPENGYAVVDVAALAVDHPSQEILASRVRKEALRAFAFLTGGAYMARGEPLMRDIKTVKDLDAVPLEKFGLETVVHVRESAPFYGLFPWRQATYKKACEEGWAPAPTNEYQRVIWEKVKADKERGPTNPITIKPPKK